MAPTIVDLIRSCENDVSDANDRVESSKAQVSRLLDDARANGREYLNAAESARSEALFADIEKHKASAKRSTARLARAREIAADEAELDANARTVTPLGPGRRHTADRGTASLSVGRNERVYRPDTDPNGVNFLLDVARGTVFGDPQCAERLQRHMAEERVERPGMLERVAGDATTTSFGVGLVVPQYLTNYYAPAVANMRPFADQMNRHPLTPEGMTLNMSTITTPTSAALQASQLATVSTTSIGETDLSLAVLTAAGSQNVSLQAIQRGTGIEAVTMGDLQKRCATVLESTVINAATTGAVATGQTITYTSASPTQVEAYPYLYQAQSKLEQALLAQARVDTVVMHNRRFNWWCSGVASTWPTLGSLNSGVSPHQQGLQITNAYGDGVRAVLANGLKVVVSANIPTNLGVGTNQDPILVCSSEESHLWEDPSSPQFIRAEAANAANLGVLLVVYEYFAYTFDRYANNPSVINGTGLVAPAGF